MSIQLSPSDHNGYTISCFGGRDGSIDLTVTGGSPPYTYEWSTGASTQDVTDLAAGYYRVAVYDSDTGSVEGELTLEEPEQLVGTATAFEYPNDFNVSCHSCYNGSIDAGAIGGVAPYTYEWRDGPTVEDRSGLGARDYTVVVHDANGCEAASITLILREPQRNDWTMSGNAGTNPTTQYIGTSDNKDVVFKTNATERLRLLASGDVKLDIPGLGAGPLYRDVDGILRSGGLINALPLPETPCAMGFNNTLEPHWRVDGNVFAHPQCDPDMAPVMGTRTPTPLKIITDDQPRMVIDVDGRVGIGTEVTGGGGLLGALTVRTGPSDWITLRTHASDPQVEGYWHFRNPLEQDRLVFEYDGTDATSDDVLTLWNNGKVSVGSATIGADPAYRLYVEGGIVARDVRVTIQPFPDYVFKSDYPLRPLPDLAAYLRTHQHLPGMPSATEVEAEGGAELGDLFARLLRTVEEQTLYILQLEQRLAVLERCAKPPER